MLYHITLSGDALPAPDEFAASIGLDTASTGAKAFSMLHVLHRRIKSDGAATLDAAA